MNDDIIRNPNDLGGGNFSVKPARKDTGFPNPRKQEGPVDYTPTTPPPHIAAMIEKIGEQGDLPNLVWAGTGEKVVFDGEEVILKDPDQVDLL